MRIIHDTNCMPTRALGTISINGHHKHHGQARFREPISITVTISVTVKHGHHKHQRSSTIPEAYDITCWRWLVARTDWALA